LPSVGRIESASHTPIKRAFFNGIRPFRLNFATCHLSTFDPDAAKVRSQGDLALPTSLFAIW
ncbi:hypothetical protein, partial [Celeribacter litoreus]|uniref:hypothetical protein n=1 Tax=Celeribacter litoreus TaxID=2876714 RepID=UPI001CCC4A0F